MKDPCTNRNDHIKTRLCCLVLCAVVFALSIIGVGSAEELSLDHFDLPQYGLRVAAPAGSIAMTRDEPNDAFLAGLGVTSEEWTSMMTENNVSFYAVPTTFPLRQLMVQIERIYLFDFDNMEDPVLEYTASLLADILFDENSPSIDTYEIHHTPCSSYVLYWRHDAEGTEDVLCLTWSNGLQISFVYSAFSGDLNDDDRALVYTLLDNITFTDADNSAQPYDAALDELDPSAYEIPEVPMTVHISENDMNIFTQDTPSDSQTLARSTLSKENMDLYVKLSGASLVITHKDDAALDFSIEIRVKDNKYPELTSWKEASDAEIGILLNAMFETSLTDYSLYRTETGVFAALDLTIDKNGFRYVTIQDGDIIYVHAKRTNGPMTEDDFALLETVVNSIEFPE